MNDEQFQACWNELKQSSSGTPTINPFLEEEMKTELTTLGPRRRFWRRMLVTTACLLAVGVLSGVIANNIVVATPVEQVDGTHKEESETLLQFIIRHAHAHARQAHRHFMGF
ncbi:MAG: hypothetical protein JNL67_20885 [Planctomycetaceae bacterium]|nr:hypothetical protein [Planctomycetaceae bacterium]